MTALCVDDIFIYAILIQVVRTQHKRQAKKTSKKVLKKCLTECAELDRIIKSPVDETLRKRLWKLVQIFEN